MRTSCGTILAAAVALAVSLDAIGGPRDQYICYRSFRPQLERTRDFAEMGIPLRCFFAANTINSGGSPYCDYPVIWKDFGKYDWSALDAQVDDFLKASPNAEFLCMIDLNTPYWATHRFWLDSFTDVTHAASDPKWIERTKEWMLDFIAYAEGKWGSRIRAYVLSGGGTSEWYEYDRGRTSLNKNKAWQKWCQELLRATDGRRLRQPARPFHGTAPRQASSPRDRFRPPHSEAVGRGDMENL